MTTDATGRLQPSTLAGRMEVAAVRYAQHGWPVFPCHAPRPDGCSCREDCGSAGKHPRTPRGLHDATVDVGQVRRWWSRWPDANIGIATGARSGLLVVDVDLPDGPASLARLETSHGRLPATCEQQTGSGGRQLLFARPDGDLGNRTRLLPGIDIRGDGGYIVVPPSRHATGNRYLWTVRTGPAPAPAWLVDLLRRPRTTPRPLPVPVGVVGNQRAGRYATAALDRELQRLATAVEGTRNDTLNRAAFSLGQLVGSGLLDRDHVAARLERVAADLGLGPTEIRRTVASGLQAGMARPRPLAPAARVTRPVVSPRPEQARRIPGRRR